ncbi:unnamed protein product [Closterium sp. NIES-54]
MPGSPRSNNGSSVTSPSRPTASSAVDNSHLQQQQQQQYQQQPMYGMPLSSQPIHTTSAAASTAAAATAATAATTVAAAVSGSSNQPGQQSNFVSTGPYQYQGAYCQNIFGATTGDGRGDLLGGGGARRPHCRRLWRPGGPRLGPSLLRRASPPPGAVAPAAAAPAAAAPAGAAPAAAAPGAAAPAAAAPGAAALAAAAPGAAAPAAAAPGAAAPAAAAPGAAALAAAAPGAAAPAVAAPAAAAPAGAASAAAAPGAAAPAAAAPGASPLLVAAPLGRRPCSSRRPPPWPPPLPHLLPVAARACAACCCLLLLVPVLPVAARCCPCLCCLLLPVAARACAACCCLVLPVPVLPVAACCCPCLCCLLLPVAARAFSTVYDPDAEERIHNRFNNELNSPIPPEVYANLAHTIAGPNTWYLDSCCGQHMCSSETRFIVNQRRLENPVVVTVANNQRLTAHWMGSIVLDSVEEDFSLHLNEVLLVPRLGFNLMSSAQLMKNGITLLGEPGKFTLKYGEKKLGTTVEQNGVFVLNFIPERTTADSDNILSLGPWEHRDDIDYTDDTVPREGVVPTSSTTAAAVMLTFDDQGLNDVQNFREYMAAVTGWGAPSNMPTDDGTWGSDEPDETTWGETPAARDARLLAEAEQRVAEMEVLDSGRLVDVEPVPAASDQESGELILAPGEYVDVEVRVPPPNLTRYVAPTFDQIRSDGHQLLLSFFANAEYYLRAQGHKATGETWHKRLGHPSQSTLNNTIKAAVLDKNSLLLPSGLELTPVNRPVPCTICPAANLPHESFPTHFPGADDYQLMDKVYSDILNLPEDGFNGERYVITFTDASTRYVWTGNMTNRFLAFTTFRTWLPLAERESDTKLKTPSCPGSARPPLLAFCNGPCNTVAQPSFILRSAQQRITPLAMDGQVGYY